MAQPITIGIPAVFSIRRKPKYPYREHGNIVLHDLKAVYFYIPKNGSSTIKFICKELLGNQQNPDQPYLHLHTYDYPFIPMEDLYKFRDYYWFAFVRDPIDRLASCYKNKILDSPRTDQWYKRGIARGFANKGGAFYAGMSFTDFALAACDISDRDADKHFRSQHHSLPIVDDSIDLDYLGRVETLEADLKAILKALDVEVRSIPHLLKTNKELPKENDLQANIIDRIKSRYRRDYELLGYYA